METSGIQWTDSTFNPWMGCTKVSDGCKNCYAERDMDKRYGKVKWGPQGSRIRTTEKYWKQPLKWNKESWGECPDCGWRGCTDKLEIHNPNWIACPECDATLVEARRRVFCASIADVFEIKKDQIELDYWRIELFRLIERTPNLDWMLLTKRAEEAATWFTFLSQDDEWRWSFDLEEDELRPPFSNVWMGVSVENQETANKRIPYLVEIPAKIHFLSCEPLLGPISLAEWLWPTKWVSINGEAEPDIGEPLLDLVIAGGESGDNARPTHPQWARRLRIQCQEARNVSFFFKQWGEWLPKGQHSANGIYNYGMPQTAHDPAFDRVGKKAAGRLLDGREWNEMPKVRR